MTAPAVASVTKFGEVGETVTVWGSGFTGATAVDFVNSVNHAATPFAGTSINVLNDGELTVVVPTGLPSSGTYDVTVTAPGGTSPYVSPDDIFASAPSITPAVVAATVVNGLASPITLPGAVGGSLTDITVNATADFTPTGKLFVQTDNGVATIQYAGITGTSFTGCTVAGDTFNVGAGDLSGVIANTNAIFQATSNRFTINIANDSNLPAGAQNAITGALYWNSTGSKYFYLDASGKFQAVPAPNNSLPTFSIPNSGGTLQLSMPYLPINSMRMYFGVGTPPDLVVNAGGGVTAPNDTSASSIVDFIEGTLNASGADNVVPLGYRNLTTWSVNTTQVDQFGMPITLTGNVYNVNDVPSPASVGVTISANVARDEIFKEFESLHSSASDPYSALVIPSSNPDQPLRILNPSNSGITQSSQLGYAFDSYIQKLFETRSDLQLVYNGITYTGAVTLDPTSTYKVLQFSSTTAGHLDPVDIYEPFFSSNAPTTGSLSPVSYAGKPSAPAWLAANETPGQMVLANDGVFSDSVSQVNASYNAADRAMLGAFEDDFVMAISRGVSSLATSSWGDASKFYVTDPVSNQYAAFMHSQAINGTPIFIDSKSYATAFDDNSGFGSFITYANQNDMTVTLGPWQTLGPSSNNSGFLAAVYQDVLHRAVDPTGQSFWLGLLAGGLTRVEVSQGIADSVEAHSDVIKNLYLNLLNRPVDSQGLSGFLNLFAAGQDAEQVKAIIYGSPEYFQVHGGANPGFVDALFQDALSRSANGQEQAYYAQLLAAGQSRTLVSSMVVESPEADQDVVKGYYLSYLKRAADATGLAYWTSLLEQQNREGLVQAGILGSAEFFNRV